MNRYEIFSGTPHVASVYTVEMMTRKCDKYNKHFVFFICYFIFLIPACGKDSVITDSPSDNGVEEHIEMEKPSYTPQAGNSGFFLDDWKPKYISSPDYSVRMKPVAFTEWNIFSTGSQQMVSDIYGMHAALALGEFIKNKFGMAARWNIANGWEDGNDHGMFNLGDEPGDMPKWNPRPDFFHMYYFHDRL